MLFFLDHQQNSQTFPGLSTLVGIPSYEATFSQVMQNQKLQPQLTWFKLSFVINLTTCEAIRLQDITMAQLYRRVTVILQHKHHCVLRFTRLNVNGRLDVSAFGNRGIFHAYLYTELVLLQLITAQRLTLTKYK